MHKTLFAFATLLAGVGAASADETSFMKSIFADPAPTAKSRACFVRHYDAQHMAQHPRQEVTDMMMLVGREKFADDSDVHWQFQISTHFTNRKGRFESGGDCSVATTDYNGKPIPESLRCGVDCDGGDVVIRNEADRKSITGRVDRLRVWRAGTAPEEGAQDAFAGGDDKLFRLDRADASECSPLLPRSERERLLSRKKK